MPKSVTSKPAGVTVLRWIGFNILVFCLTLIPAYEALAKTSQKTNNTQNEKYASLVVDAETGAVISERYSNKRVHPASLTKVMTLMLLFEALESGNVRLNDKILISKYAASQQPSKLGLSPGSSIRVEDAILAVVTKSANDIAAAIGEHLAGSERRFAERMTHRAHAIGMTRTKFTNASGLHNPAQITTARDMATLARYVLIRYPNYYRYFGTKQFTYRGKTMTNHNRLMNTYPGMDGFKTGFINASGFNLIASAQRNGHRLIGIVFGGRSWKSRNDHMAALLNTAFNEVGDTRYAQKGTATVAVAPAPAQAPMPLPVQKPQTDVAAAQTLQLPVPRPDQANTQAPQDFASLTQSLTQPQPVPDVTEQAAARVKSALNSGAYSELTGEGDYDPGTMRRVEAGLLSAAVYKGEHEKVQQLQLASAASSAQKNAGNAAILQAPPAAAPTPVALPPEPAAAVSDLWSVQIGAYTSRVATDDALRLAATKLPASLSHARPIVVPLNTAQGMLFRARLGNFTKDEASSACRYYRDCLPVAPR